MLSTLAMSTLHMLQTDRLLLLVLLLLLLYDVDDSFAAVPS